ncbi:MAG: LysM peptidoglycan-binding domain-containing protein [Verrucomicrobiaceae bacterium]|nr:MAG: LysM peptidoglycan-binding domain-containing protein [Verrucomicrobiaceae bacterium]
MQQYHRLLLPLCAVAVLGLSGCEQLFDKGAKQSISAADKKMASGEIQAAIRLYESALDGSSVTAEAHYKLGLIYADKLKRPMDALHHFERYLELSPSGTYAKEARAYRKEGEQKLLISLTKGSPVTQDEAVRLKNDNLTLRKQLVELRARKNATPPPTPAGMKKGEQVRKPIPPGSRMHMVRGGETLASIAKHYYKNTSRWRDIQDANFYALEGTAKIKPGMELIIPK